MNMNPGDFDFYKKYLYEKSGLSIGEEKIYLLNARLAPLAKKWGFTSIDEMTKSLRTGLSKEMSREVVDVMTTNETLFFRDDRPFKYFKMNALPELLKAREGKKSLRIWSAACSTGQEPFSIAMTLADTIPAIQQWNIDIYATDISETALKKAQLGKFNQFEIQRGLPITMLMKYFVEDGHSWRISDQILKMVRFENFNLLNSMNALGTFDIIFCRNVLIYFDEPTKKKVLTSLIARMAPDGILFLGGAETALGLCPELKKIDGNCPSLYKLHTDNEASTAAHKNK